MALHLKHRVNLHMTFRCPLYVYDNTGVRVIMTEEFMTVQKNHKVSLFMLQDWSIHGWSVQQRQGHHKTTVSAVGWYDNVIDTNSVS